MHRDEWNKKLDTLFCQYQLGDGSYQKNYKDIYELVNIDNGVDKAIQNAKRRMEDFYLEKRNPSSYNPGTTVYQLVEE